MCSKIEELVLYIAEKSKDDLKFGLTKLNKILFASDFSYYGATGKLITGTTYVHRTNGPVPKDMQLVLINLESAKRAYIKEVEYFGYPQKRIVPRGGADTSSFSEEELEYIDHYIDHFKKLNATDLSDWTHTLRPWLVTGDGDEIPYYSIFVLYNRPIEKDSVTWAIEELDRLRRDENYTH
jgi:hypothetical protein